MPSPINTHIYETTGLAILFKFKDYKPENIYTKLIEKHKASNLPDIEDMDGVDLVVIPSKQASKQAGEVVVSRYGDSIVNCNGILYVKHDNIWLGDNVKMADNVLTKFMRDINICYYADKFSIASHSDGIDNCDKCIKDIRTNLNIINNKFMTDMLKNNKLYLPFNDGVYSFIDKKNCMIMRTFQMSNSLKRSIGISQCLTKPITMK
jgi:hypothetical protein